MDISRFELRWQQSTSKLLSRQLSQNKLLFFPIWGHLKSYLQQVIYCLFKRTFLRTPLKKMQSIALRAAAELAWLFLRRVHTWRRWNSRNQREKCVESFCWSAPKDSGQLTFWKNKQKAFNSVSRHSDDFLSSSEGNYRSRHDEDRPQDAESLSSLRGKVCVLERLFPLAASNLILLRSRDEFDAFFFCDSFVWHDSVQVNLSDQHRWLWN